VNFFCLFSLQITADQPEFFSIEDVVQSDGQWANTSDAFNWSQTGTTEDDFYRHSPIVTTVYCLACKKLKTEKKKILCKGAQIGEAYFFMDGRDVRHRLGAYN
jgi:hypothetical protein